MWRCWCRVAAIALGLLGFGPAGVEASRTIELDTGKLTLEAKPEHCITGTFKNFFEDEDDWPYLLAALYRCQGVDAYEDVPTDGRREYKARIGSAVTTIAAGLVSKMVDDSRNYADVKHLWTTLMGFCQRNEIDLPRTTWGQRIFKSLLESSLDEAAFEDLFLDTLIILDKIMYFWEEVIDELKDKGLRHQLLMVVYALNKDVRSVKRSDCLYTLRSALSSLDEGSIFYLPEGFRTKFVKRLLELTQGQTDARDLIQSYFQTNSGLWIQELSAGDALKHPRLGRATLFLPPNYQGEEEGEENVMDYYLQFVMTEFDKGALVAEALKRVGHVALEGLCRSYKSPHMQWRLSVLASAAPPSESPPERQLRTRLRDVFTVIQEFMGENCKQSYEVVPAGPDIPVIGDEEYLRNNNPMDKDLLLIDDILAKAQAHHGYVPEGDVVGKLGDPRFLARLYLQTASRIKTVRATSRTAEVPYNVTDFLRWTRQNLGAAYEKSTHSGAFRTLVLASVKSSELGVDYLRALCAPGEGDYCRSLYEASLRDTLFNELPSRMMEWTTAVDDLGNRLVEMAGDCGRSTLYACSQSIVTPNIAHVEAAIRQMTSINEQVRAVKTIGPWIPPTFLENNYDAQTFSLLIKTAFYGGDLQRIREYLRLAPATLADTEGMRYATWIVTHVQALPASNMVTPQKTDILTNALKGDKRPTFEDLCQDSRCVLLTDEEMAMTQNGRLLKEVHSTRSKYHLQEELEKVVLDIVAPDPTRGTLADVMVYEWCNAYKQSITLLSRKQLFENIMDGYIGTIGSRIEFGDHATTLANLTNLIADRQYQVKTEVTHLAQLQSDQLRRKLRHAAEGL